MFNEGRPSLFHPTITLPDSLVVRNENNVVVPIEKLTPPEKDKRPTLAQSAIIFLRGKLPKH